MHLADAPATRDQTKADEPGRPAWTVDTRTLLVIAAASFLLLALVALASAIDFSGLKAQDEPTPSQSAEPRTEIQESFGGGPLRVPQPAPGGEGGSGRIDLGRGGELDVRPIPGCPDGFSIGEDIYVVPDPEACGFRRLPPGSRGLQDSGKILLVPDRGGDVGGFRLDGDGGVDLVRPEDVRPDDIVIGRLPDGSFQLQRPDGSRLDIAPGDDGLSLRDPVGGDTRFVPRPGVGDQGQGDFGQGDFGQGKTEAQREAQQRAQEEALRQWEDEQRERAEERERAQQREEQARRDGGDGAPFDFSVVGPILLVLIVVVAVVALLLGAKNLPERNKKIDVDDGTDDDDDDDQEQLQNTLVDYSVEINALDQLLWEIDQEPDPRRAIRRVYAALETGLNNPEMARRRSETPGIYLHRILGRFDSLNAPLRELTSLFEQARFSEHEITPAMRNRAVEILVAVRGTYASVSAPPQPAGFPTS